jgi:hypothetical protein
MKARIKLFNLNYFIVYAKIICLNFVQVRQRFPIRTIWHKSVLYWRSHSGMALGLVFVFGRYVHLGFAFGGTRCQKGGKNTAVIGWTVFVLLRVGVSPLAG